MMADVRKLSERVAHGALGRVERWSRDARTRLTPAEPAAAPAARIGGAEPAPTATPQANVGRYGNHWSPVETGHAMAQIFNTEDPESFERGGRQDAELLAGYHDVGSTVLDLGCGMGRVALYMAPTCKELWAVDASSRMLELAGQRMAEQPNVRYALCHDTTIPDAPDASIDLIYSLLVLQHLEREDAFLLLRELRRIIKPTGIAYLTFPNLLSEVYWESFVHYAETNEQGTNPVRARIYTPQEVERVLAGAGFSVEIDAGTELRCVCRPVGPDA